MSQEQQHINYSASDIERYFTGKMTAPEMHAMEKAALDDPFLAEAMEGYEAVAAADWKPALASLQKEFAGNNTTAKVVVMHKSRTNWWKTVAAIFVIGTGSALTYFLTRQPAPQNPEIAKVITAPQQSSSHDSTAPVTGGNVAVITENGREENVAVIKPAPVKQDQEAVTKPEAVTENKNAGPAAAPTTPAQGELSATDDRKQAQDVASNSKTQRNLPAPVMNNNVASNRSRADENVISNKDAEKEQATKKPAMANASAAGKALTSTNNFFAQVLAADNTPLPFSNINVRTANFETYADVKGNFRLVSADTVLTVEIKSVGYQPKTFTLRSNQASNKIVLNPDEMAMADKTVVMAKRKATPGAAPALSRRAVLIKDSVANVEPADGWDNYNTYIANNIDLPDEMLKNNAHGQIGISFDVDANGTISNIKIDPSRCSNCEALTRKLIEQGPQWKNKKGAATSAKFTVTF